VPFISTASLIALIALLTAGAASRHHDSANAPTTGTVVYVVDGDTIHVRIRDTVEKVRYLGVNAPEVPHPRGRHERGPRAHEPRHARGFAHGPAAGDAARRINVELVSGRQVRLEFEGARRDSYRRMLAYVWVGDTMANAEMVRRGYAEVTRLPPDARHRALLESLEREAREAGRGLWQHATGVTARSAAPRRAR
jgi:micrococcal nuclease